MPARYHPCALQQYFAYSKAKQLIQGYLIEVLDRLPWWYLACFLMCSRYVMPRCQILKSLQKPSAEASARTRYLLEAADRLPLVTGFTSDQILDLIQRALLERKAACTALTSHIETHHCHPGECDWPLPNCRACS